ncbi:hypothetical protein Tco_1295082 [Tanacetum coccineum]
MVPRAVLMKFGLVSVNTVRQVNTAHSKTTVNAARPMPYLTKKAHSTVKRPIYKNTAFKNSNFNQRVNTIKDKNVNTIRPRAVINAARPKAIVNAFKGNNVNAVKALICWVWKPKTKVLDHASKHNSASTILKRFDYIDAQGISKSMEDMLLLEGTFDGKADEGFFVGYSLNSKAFRVFKSRTRIVEENLHIRYTANDFADTKASDNTGQARKETEPIKNYILLPLWPADPPFSQDLKSSQDEWNQNLPSDDERVNAIGGKTSIELPLDTNMLELEDYSIFEDYEDVGAEADMHNLDTTIQVSLIPTTRIHKDHPLNQVIGDYAISYTNKKMSKRF